MTEFSRAFINRYVYLDQLQQNNSEHAPLITGVGALTVGALFGLPAGVGVLLLGGAYIGSQWRRQDQIEADIRAGQVAKYFKDLSKSDRTELTRLADRGVLDKESVPSLPVAKGPALKVVQEPSHSQGVEHRPVELDEDAPHICMLAGTREGKSNALRHLLRNAETVHYVTTKINDQVPVHWNGYLLQGDSRAKQIEWVIDDWSSRLKAHCQDPSLPAEWFVLDEATTIPAYARQSSGRLAKRLSELQVEMMTQGAGVGCFLVLMAQTKNAGPLGVDLDLLQQNMNVIVPIKRKRSLGMSSLEKIGGIRLSEAQRISIVNNPAPYLQLWLGEDEEVYFDTIKEVKANLKPLVSCPVTGIAFEENSEELTRQAVSDRVVSFLSRDGSQHTVAGVRKNVRPLPNWSKDDVAVLLCELVTAGRVEKDGDRYFVSDPTANHSNSINAGYSWREYYAKSDRSVRLVMEYAQSCIEELGTTSATYLANQTDITRLGVSTIEIVKTLDYLEQIALLERVGESSYKFV